MSEEAIKLKTNQYLTFSLDNETYGIEVSMVREVLEFSEITKVPRMADFMCGIINLRGSVVPVADLRKKFKLPDFDAYSDTSIIVSELLLDGEMIVIGALVDSVHEVIEINPEQIEKTPQLGTSIDSNNVKGIGKHKENFIIILDINLVFNQALLEASIL